MILRRIIAFLAVFLFACAVMAPHPALRARVKVSGTVAAGSTLNNGIVAYWKMDEASGNRADSVGSITLFDSNTVASATGKISNAGDFENGASEFLASAADPAAVDFANVDFTIALWVQLESKGVRKTFLAKYDDSGQAQYYVQWNNSNDRLIFGVSNDGSAEVEVAAGNLGIPALATWYFIVAWHDAAANTINIKVNDGTTDSAAHTTGVFNSTSKLIMGMLGLGSGFHDGFNDEVGIWNRVLTGAEMTELYNSNNGKTHPF